jgi:hypothetical protein
MYVLIYLVGTVEVLLISSNFVLYIDNIEEQKKGAEK